MNCFANGFPRIAMLAGAIGALVAAAAVVVVASFTSWWLLALGPLAMMLGCMVMMAGRAQGADPRRGPGRSSAAMSRDERERLQDVKEAILAIRRRSLRQPRG